MSWVVRASVKHWVGEFPEPEDRELAPYGYRHPNDVDELAIERARKSDPPAIVPSRADAYYLPTKSRRASA